MRARPTIFALLTAVTLAASPVGAQPPAPVSRPNIILCMTDDQGWGDVGYNGLKQIRTPALDSMAASGLRFDRFYAQQSCSPTRASVMTGRHPNRMGVFWPGMPMRRQEVTVAQAAQAAGYVTAHFGKWHLNGVAGPGKPIAASDPLGPGCFGFDEWFSVSNYFDLDWTFSHKGRPVKVPGDGSEAIVAEALKFIDARAKRKEPFFACIWFGNPHAPHKALPTDLKAAGGSAYFGQIVAIDRSMGTLRKGLRELGIADNTLVWFCSDNGGWIDPAKPNDNGVSGGLRGRKGDMWEGGIRVPAVIEWPARIKQPAVSDMPAGVIDIYPTIVEILGVEVPNQVEPLDGLSLLPLLDGHMTERPKPMGFWQANGPTAAGPAAWSDNRYKLVTPRANQWELYDLVADRSEQTNVAAEHPEIAGRMKAELLAWKQSVLRSYRGEDYRASSADATWSPSAKSWDAAASAGQFDAYFANLSAWLNRQVPADPTRISDDVLKRLLDDSDLVAALDQWQLLSKQGLAELAAFAREDAANRVFLAWLFNSRQALDLYLQTAVPLDLKAREENTYRLAVRNLAIWSKIVSADPDAKEGLPLRLAVATALRPPGAGNRGAGMQPAPSDPVVRYQYFKSAHKNKELFPSFDRLTAWEYQFVVSSCASEEDLTWARQLINTWRPDLRLREQVVNSTSEVKYGKPLHPFTDYKSVLAAGGQCGPRSSWSVMICQAFGIPAIGVSQPGHACVAYKAADPSVEPQPGSAWKVAYGRGWQASKLEGLSGPDFVAAVQERSRAADFSRVEHLRWLAAALASPERATAVMQVAHRIQASASSAATDLAASAKAEEAEKEPPAAKIAAPAVAVSKEPVKLAPGVTRIEASGFAASSGIRVLDCFTGGKQANFQKNIKDSWAEYTLDVAVPGSYRLTLQVAAANDNQVLQVNTGAASPATIQLPNTTGLWGTTPAAELRLEKGIQTLRLSAPFQRGVAVRWLEISAAEKVE